MAHTPSHDSLAARFAALQATREREWSAQQLAGNRAQRDAARAGFDPAKAVKVGDTLPDATLLDTAGQAVRLSEVTRAGPAVLVFFRFASCAADNIALPYYDAELLAPLRAAGAALVAISPQVPERLAGLRDTHALGLTIASDPDNALARHLGITFVPADRPAPPPPGWVGDVTGTGTWELPLTSVLVIDRTRTVRHVAISPDWLDRAEAEEILAAVARTTGLTTADAA